MREKHKLNSGNLVYAVILARSGSKTIKNKNIRKLNNKPLLSYPINAALKSKRINSTYVLTDSKKYAEISSSLGAKVPFLRPKTISGDYSRDFETFKYFFEWLKKNNQNKPDIIVHLRATAPLVNTYIINKALIYFLKNKSDSLKSIQLSKSSPFKMWKINKYGYMIPFVKSSKNKEFWNFPRQKLPIIYSQNAQIDIFRTSLINKNTISGKKILPFYIENSIDIDDLSDLKKIKLKLKKN